MVAKAPPSAATPEEELVPELPLDELPKVLPELLPPPDVDPDALAPEEPDPVEADPLEVSPLLVAGVELEPELVDVADVVVPVSVEPEEELDVPLPPELVEGVAIVLLLCVVLEELLPVVELAGPPLELDPPLDAGGGEHICFAQTRPSLQSWPKQHTSLASPHEPPVWPRLAPHALHAATTTERRVQRRGWELIRVQVSVYPPGDEVERVG